MSLQGLPGRGGRQAHPGKALPSSDQRLAGAYHQTLKRDVNQLPYDMPSDLDAVIVAFVSYYDYRRYHKAMGNVTPSDTLRGRRENILRRTTEVQAQTIKQRRRHNRALREMARP